MSAAVLLALLDDNEQYTPEKLKRKILRDCINPMELPDSATRNFLMTMWKYNMNGICEDIWSPYKQLQKVIQKAIVNPTSITINELEINFKEYKQIFGNLLRNPPRNESNRIKLCKGIIEGFPCHGYNRNMVISKDLVDESLIISDMFDLDEIISLELLCTAQRQIPLHPGLPRGLVAILLYYDGRKAIAYSLRDLFHVTSGISWVTDLPKEVIRLISTFTQSLVDDCNIIERIIELLDCFDPAEETLMLAKNRALGPKKHQNQVLELFEDIRLALATSLFNWSAQRGLSKATVVKLVKSISKYKTIEPSGSVDDVTLTMLMALLYSYDASFLQRYDDCNPVLQSMPFMNEPEFVQEVYETLTSDYFWEHKNRLDSIAKFSFGLSLACLRQAPQDLQNSTSKFIERDEYLIDEALSNNIFEFIYYYLLEKNIIFETEFFYRRIHLLFTDFIDLMHSKLTELRGKADETAKTIISFTKEGLEPPSNLDHNFEMLMLCIGKFYKNNRAGLSLCIEYWGPLDTTQNCSRSTTRSVALFKFIRLAGELLPTTLFVPYLKMIIGLTSCERSARSAFNLLKHSAQLSGSTTLSWEHFFGSLTRYYSNLRHEQCLGSDTLYKIKACNRCINPQEVEGLHAVLEIIEAVAKHDEIARISICDHPSWAPLQILLGLLSCPVPLSLKANILKTLSAFAKTKESAVQLWNNLEVSQIITTIPNTNSYNLSNIEVEIEQIESRYEKYPLSKGILDLLYSLVTTIIPKSLGAGLRKPGLDPYLTFITNAIFLKFYNRTYKCNAEKWEIAEKCLKMLHYLLLIYEVNPQDFDENRDDNPPPGFHIMLYLHMKSDMLRMILFIIDDVRLILDDYKKFTGKETLEKCALHCLNIIEKGLEKQELFFEAHSTSNSSVLLAGLNKILLDVNPRSKKPDHILNTTKFICYSNWLPQHALVAVNILNMMSRLPNVSSQILDMFTTDDCSEKEIRNGFIECLENEFIVSRKSNIGTMHEKNVVKDMSGNTINTDLQIKEAIIKLLQNCLHQPLPNITYFLLGLDSIQDICTNHRQGPKTFDSSSNCMKSVVSLLDDHLEITNNIDAYDEDVERVVELSYSLLFSLCANTKTSDIVFRYLRSYNDFLFRHLSALPFKHSDCSYVLHQMSFLLKCAAIELKIAASSCQISRFQHFCELLLETSGKFKRDDIAMEINHYYSHSSNMSFEIPLSTKPYEKMSNVLICRLLDGFKFDADNQQMPKYEFFDNTLAATILKDCEVSTRRGLKLIDLKKLHEILIDELCTVQSTITSGQSKLIMQEIESVLVFAVNVNSDRKKSFAAVKLMEAWSQVTEILFSCTPDAAMPYGIKLDLILEILQKILTKVASVGTNFEMSLLASGTILLLLFNLRNCYHGIYDLGEANDTSTAAKRKESYANSSSSKSHLLSLKFIAKNIMEWIINSSFTSQNLRVNLYAALLNCLRIVDKKHFGEPLNRKYECFVLRLDKTVGKTSCCFEPSQVYKELVNTFGDELVDIICNDSVASRDICKMTALSCVDVFLNTDSVSDLVNFFTSKGYLSHIINSLSDSDEDLCLVLHNSSENLKPIYIYESKMAVLIRLANSHVGAEILLVGKVLEVLSRMKVFDTRPDIYGNANSVHNEINDFVPAVDERFRQILFPALNLCNCIISSLGIENHSAVSQIMYFIHAHCDMFEMVLRAGSPYVNTNSLKELVALTALVARTTNQELIGICDQHQNYDKNLNFYRIQNLMLSVFNRFITNDNVFLTMGISDNMGCVSIDSNSNLYVTNFLEITSNLSLFCRNAIANHSADHKANRILFSPNVERAIHSHETPGSNIKRTYGIGLVLDLLKGSVEYFNCQVSLAEGLLRQRESLPDISFDRTAGKHYLLLTELLNNKKYDISICSFIVEQCLYLLWSHLDFFAHRILDTSAENSGFIINKPHAQDTFEDMMISRDYIISLKKILISVFNETFCKKLSSSESFSEANERFNDVILRRIKSLIQLIPVN